MPNDNDLANKVMAYIALATGGITAAAYAIKASWPRISGTWKMLKEMNEVIHAVPSIIETRQDISKVKQEVSVDGGASMKDAVLRIEANCIRNEQAILRLETLQSRLAAKQLQTWKNASVFLFYMDENGFLTEANDSLLEFLDRDERQLQRLGWVSALHVDKRRIAVEEWESAMKQRRTFEIETIFVVGGQNVPVLIRAVPLVIGGNTIIGYDGTVRSFKS